jgi:Baseplate J-like protein
MANTLITTNVDIDYIAKDFTSVEDDLITFATAQFGAGTNANQLWTDFNTSSFSRVWLELVAFISDILFFYLDTQATQAYLQTATVRSAVLNVAKQFGFTPATASSASGVEVFTVTGAGTIPRGFQLNSINNEVFYVTNDVIVGGAGQFSGNVLQGIIIAQSFTAEGVQNETFQLQGPNVIVDLTNLNTLDVTPQLSVNGNNYTLVTTFINSNGTDTAAVEDSLGNVIGGGGRVFLLGQNPDGTPFIQFGDGVFGRQLLSGEVVSITYRTGGGSAGNIGANSLVNLISGSSIITSATNPAAFSGGTDENSIDNLRDLIPDSLRTLERAVALQDYGDILVANFPQVFDANAELSPNTNASVDLNVYVVPQGTGVPALSDNLPLKNQLFSFLDTRKTVTVNFQLLDAFAVTVLLSVEIFVASGVDKTVVTNNLNAAFAAFFNLTTGGPNGQGIKFAQSILIKDIIAVIETIPGIDTFELTKLTYVPRIQESVVSPTATYNTTPVSIFPNVSESEWLLAAAGIVTRSSGVTLFLNTGLVSYTYTSGTGVIQYSFTVDLSKVSAGDTFIDGSGMFSFTILGVDTLNNKLILGTGLMVNTAVSSSSSGSVLSGITSFESFRCFKKLLAVATSLQADSITDNNLDLSVVSSSGTAVENTLLLDDTLTFVPNQYATGGFLLVDASNNIWTISSNTSNTIRTSLSAINNAAITSIASGSYQIVQNLAGTQIVFSNEVLNINYNTANTIFSIGAEFSSIGIIGETFQLSTTQTNIGNLGVNVDIVAYNSSTNTVEFNSSPDLSGINSSFNLIDNTGQVFNIVGVNDTPQPAVLYSITNQSNKARLSASGVGISPIQFGAMLAQGFKVPSTALYPIVSFYLSKEGNITGNLTVRIVNDLAGLPDLTSVVAVSNVIPISTLVNDTFTQIFFSFATPPTLTSGTQYHAVLIPDATYISNTVSDFFTFTNSGLVTYTYNSGSGLIQYASAVNLSSVVPGNYFEDGAGNLFRIITVNDAADQLVLATGLTVNTTVGSSSSGACIQDDRVTAAIDDSSHSYPDGEMSRYSGLAWSNSTLGPSPSSIHTDMIFSVEGTKTITIESDLTPITGLGATISSRYYDDHNEMSLIVGISAGIITSATDVVATGLGTVGGDPNRPVDTFVFRSSEFLNDITNLRQNEIPQL